MKTNEINQILKDANLDFKPTDKRLHTKMIYYGFHEDNIKVVINKGLYEYRYYNFYEVMLWYRYYTCKYHNIMKRSDDMYRNACYFSRIPHHYRNTDPQKGLNIVKEAMISFIQFHNGIPKYFTIEELDDRYCYIN